MTRGESVRSVLQLSRGEQWDSFTAMVKAMEEGRDLLGLAEVAQTGLSALRQLCERPVTCALLDQTLATLDDLNLDGWEMGEDS